jgi:very-short-patch-repair endonuclease
MVTQEVSCDAFSLEVKMDEYIKTSVRDSRKTQTISEKILWDVLRNRKLSGWKFLRQHAICFEYQGRIRFFKADFFCHEARLIIELDGKIHEYQAEYDEYRTFIINQLGFRVERIKNEELKDIATIIAKIKGFLER